jgi:predicted N-acetyltransferase YhbS
VSPRVRLTTKADAALLPDVERSAGDLFRTIPELAWVADHSVTSEAEHLAFIANGLSWVAVDAHDAPIGFVVCEYTDGALFVNELAVRADVQRQGAGRALIAAAHDHARAKKLPAITLTTFRTVPWNAPYYERLGYRVLAEHQLTPHLAAALANEAARGLPDRVAMRAES